MKILSLEGVSKTFSKRWVALYNVSFALDSGEFVFLVGPSGAGKSTLISAVLAQIPIDDGMIAIDGEYIDNIPKRKIPYLRRKLGVIFQDFKLLPDMTARENVEFALRVCGYPKKLIRMKGNELLSQVGLGHKARVYPHELSGGERQRVGIARALVHSPLLLMADEPTGNLDPHAIEEIMELLLSINKQGTAILMATHNIELIERYNFRVLELSEGNLIGDRPSRLENREHKSEGSQNDSTQWDLPEI